MNFIVLLVFSIILIVLGVIEKIKINKNVNNLEIRINVNGIRGKSTATRFITAILQEVGYKVIGKTTGTSARIIFWNREEEFDIHRKPVGANIGEQISVMNMAVEKGANALVCECMAVKPEYQRVYQNEIIQANIMVITNVIEDHLDEMGPTTDQIAWTFASTIPENGILIITKGPYSDYFTEEANKKNTKVICIDPAIIEKEYISSFEYIVFPNNCAIGIGIAQALGIDEEVAKKAMLKAHPDPGIAQIVTCKKEEKRCWLVNAFAANEPQSTLEIWYTINERNYSDKDEVVVLCCRDDRVDRTEQFINDFLPYVKAKYLFLIGTGTLEVINAYQNNKFVNIEECIDLTHKDEKEIINEIYQVMNDNVVFCAGNIHGVAEKFLEEFAGIYI